MACSSSTAHLAARGSERDGLASQPVPFVHNKRLRRLARTIPGTSVDRGYQIADTIHRSGQAIVWSGQREPAEHYWEQLQAAGLTMAPLERD